MPATLSLPTNMTKTHHRCCRNCALVKPAPTLCARLIESDGTLSTGKVADRARSLMEEHGLSDVKCTGWRYEYMVAGKHKGTSDGS